ncbi:hypothetical protein L208DRAFT_1410755 [Tricholoma matsutake]|nr:hypothetical protein L208DRAFT_1410755 [Tricholoma matsutake 945]
MFTTNPYAQAGWYNPENPYSINNSTWGSQSPPPASIFGALPGVKPPSPPSTLTLIFTSFNPTILDSTVVGPKFQKYFTISTSRSTSGHPFTMFYKHNGESVAVVEWHQNPTLQIRDIVSMQPTAQWLRPGPDPSYKSMEVNGKWYAWAIRQDTINLYTVGPSPPVMLAKISRDINAVRLEITNQAIQAGLLEVSVVSTVLFQSGLNFG